MAFYARSITILSDT